MNSANKRRKLKVKQHLKEAPNLQRFRLAVEHLSQDHAIPSGENYVGSQSLGRTSTLEHDIEKETKYGILVAGKSRKQKRKEARELKKACKNAFLAHKPMPHVEKETRQRKRKEKAEAKRNKRRERRKRQKVKEKEMKKSEKTHTLATSSRITRLLHEIKKEDAVIKVLEKNLKIKKTRKTIPKAFVDDGLDYLLDFCGDNEGKKNFYLQPTESNDVNFVCSEGEATVTESFTNDVGKFDANENIANVDSEDEESETMSDYKEVGSEKLGNTSDSAKGEFSDADEGVFLGKVPETDNSNISKDTKVISQEEVREDVLTEDIYGRIRDGKGNIVSSTPWRSHRSQDTNFIGGSNEQELNTLKKQMKGLLNRLSESNMALLTSQIESLYWSHSRSNVNKTLGDLIMSACVGPALMPEKLSLEHAMLISLLHNTIGAEVSAHLLEILAETFERLYQCSDNNGLGKECDNLVVFFGHLYSFGVIHSRLIFDYLKKFIARFQEKDVELILLLLKDVGFGLRKDDPLSLKEVIQMLQSKCASVNDVNDQSRMKFMLEIIMAIKNNNMRKIPNYDPSQLEHLKRVLKGLLRNKGSMESSLKISLDDLLNVENKGRWWIVGSAWHMNEQPVSRHGLQSQSVSSTGVSEKVLQLARQQRMNTDVRKSVFYAMMSSEDYLDAFEKLLHIGLRGEQEREIIHVIMDCALQERSFNPFYSYLAQKFCKYNRRFVMTLKFFLWDKFASVSSLSSTQIDNLIKSLIRFISADVISLAVFKVIDFAELNKGMVNVIRQVLLDMLLQTDEEISCHCFSKIAVNPKLKMLREGLLLFLQHFLIRNCKLPCAELEKLKQRVNLVEMLLTSAESKSFV